MQLIQTKGELISQVRNELKLANADSRLSNRIIWSIIRKHMQWLIKRDSRKLRIMGQDNVFQTYKCVDIIDAPAIDDCCGVKSKCKIFRTESKVPTIYEDEDGVIVKSVFTIDGSRDFSFIKVSEYMRKLENPHSKYDKSLYFFYNNGYLYFPKSTIRKVMVKAYFIDEIDNSKCDVCPDDKPICISELDKPARFPGYLLGELMQAVLNELAGMYIKIQDDEQIDKNDNRRN